MQELDTLNNIKYKIQTLQKTKQSNDEKMTEYSSDLKELNEKLEFIIEARQYYKKAIDVAYERSIYELKDVLNSALSYVFFDRNYEVDIVLSDVRGKSIRLKITDDGKPANLKTGTGMGVKCVVSAVLHIYYLQCKNSKILVLDEAYSPVSVEYIENFFTFLKQLCEKLQFRIILVTHIEKFKEFGDKKYTVVLGKVKCNE